MGSDCDFVARGEILDEVLKVGAEHGNEFHEISEITPGNGGTGYRSGLV